MKFKKIKKGKRSKGPISSIVFFSFGTLVALIAIAFLVNNIILFKDVMSQYVEQGYPSSVVMQQLVPSQLLPGVFEPIAVYGGIAFLLFGIGIINRKVTKVLSFYQDRDITDQGEIVNEMIEADSEAEQSPDDQLAEND